MGRFIMVNVLAVLMGLFYVVTVNVFMCDVQKTVLEAINGKPANESPQLLVKK